MQINWKLSVQASCFHAAHSVFERRPISDAHVEEAMRDSVEYLRSVLAEERVPAEGFWRHMVPLAAEYDSSVQLTDVVLRKCIGALEAAARVRHVQDVVSQVRKSFLDAQPSVLQSLNPAWETLKQQWARQGEGLLAGIEAWTDPGVIVEQAGVIGVFPVTGGGGAAHLPSNRAFIEVVPSDEETPLPESMRLAWLLSQLNLEVPRFAEKLSPRFKDVVPALAMVPVVVAAGEPMKLTSLDDETITRALKSWMPQAESMGDTLLNWWEVYLGMRPSWPDALHALDRLLLEEAAD